MENLPIHIVDIGVLIIVLISAILACFRGAVIEILSILGWIASIIVAYYLSPYLTPTFLDWVNNDKLAAGLSFATVTLLALIFFAILNHFISNMVDESPFKSLDHTLGFLFGALRGFIIVSLFYILYTILYPSADPVDDFTKKDPKSFTISMVAGGASIVKDLLPDGLNPSKDQSISQSAEKTKDDAINTGKKILENSDLILNTIIDKNGEEISPAPSAPQRQEEGYDDDERQNIDRLFESAE